jgi:hypothetical protein
LPEFLADLTVDASYLLSVATLLAPLALVYGLLLLSGQPLVYLLGQ